MGWGLCEKGDRIKQKKKKKPHRHRQEYGDYQREREWREVEEVKGWINGDGRRLDME